jgi:outer membrane lipoprotein-sorting protein
LLLIFRRSRDYLKLMNKYITFLSIAASAFLFITPVLAEKISLTSLTQINSDGSQDDGQLYIKRPGRLRLEYASPNNALVIASSGTVAIYDDKSKSGPAVFPLKQTPLKLLIQKNVDLKNNGMVSKHIEKKEHTIIIVRDPKGKVPGEVEMTFSSNPTTLRRWTIVDQSNQKTTIILGKLHEQKFLPWSFFSISMDKPDVN